MDGCLKVLVMVLGIIIVVGIFSENGCSMFKGAIRHVSHYEYVTGGVALESPSVRVNHGLLDAPTRTGELPTILLPKLGKPR
jgi:hypothetical protein